MSRIIEIIVSPSGDSQIETKGFAGNECLLASRFIETALGKATGQSTTSEFFSIHATDSNRQKIDTD